MPGIKEKYAPSRAPWGLVKLTSAYPILLELEPKVFRTSLIVVDQSHHWETPRTARVIMANHDYTHNVIVGDRVLIRGSKGKTRTTDDKVMDEKYRFVKESDIEAILPERLVVDARSSRPVSR